MFGKTVLGIDGELFAEALDALKARAGRPRRRRPRRDRPEELVETFKTIVRDETGEDVPAGPARAAGPGDPRRLRLLEHRPGPALPPPRAHPARPRHRGQRLHAWSSATSAPTPAPASRFTRDPATGQPGVYGDYLPNAQGEDVVAGIRNTAAARPTSPSSTRRRTTQLLDDHAHAWRRHYRDLCDIEFTVERGKLWMLQTRVGKRTAAAAFRIAAQLVDEDLITLDEALDRVTGEQLAQLMFPQFDSAADRDRCSRTASPPRPAPPWAAAVFDSADAVGGPRAGEQVVLVRQETNPDDLHGMIAAAGRADQPGRQDQPRGRRRPRHGQDLRVRRRGARRRPRRAGASPRADGHRRGQRGRRRSPSTAPTGEVFLGERAASSTPRSCGYFEDGLDAAWPTYDGRPLVRAVDRILATPTRAGACEVRANADTAEDAARARRFGAAGHRAVPHRAHVPRRPPRAGRAR